METIIQSIAKSGGFFYIKGNDSGSYDIVAHVPGLKKEVKVDKATEFEAVRKLNMYQSKYGYGQKNTFVDLLEESEVSLSELAEEYNRKLEEIKSLPTRDELQVMKLKGPGGLHELCKKYNLENYSRLEKDVLVDFIMAHIKNVILK